MAENAHDKGRRLLVEGRVVIRHVGEHHIVAHVRGDSAEVYVVAGASRGWSCSCPALGRCSHLVAVQLVTLTPRIGP
jgi:uncharacterized Zn finger protein